MRIELKKRDGISSLFSVLSPFIALALTLIAGVILFLFLQRYFIDGLAGAVKG